MRALSFALFAVGALVVSGCGRDAAAALPNPVRPLGPVGPSVVEASTALPSVRVAAPTGTGMAALDALAWEERLPLEQALAASDPRYAPGIDERGPVLETPGSAVVRFGTGGAELAFGDRAPTTLAVVAIGRGGALVPLAAGARHEVAGAEVRTSRGAGVVEWWRSLPSGLEHGVTIAERPSGAGELVVEVGLRGALAPRLVSDDAVELRDAAGVGVATYAHLVVLDADGTRVPARMGLDGERIALRIADADARYPLVVDPLITAQEATLLAPDGAAADSLGYSVVLSSDGTRAVVGAFQDGTAGGAAAGSARVFLRTGAVWTEEATLLAPDGAASDHFGISVAVSSDGSYALVGAYQDDRASGADAGSARVFLRTGTTWAEEAALVAPDGAAGDWFGYSVALSSDGSRALVGAYRDDTVAGGNAAGSARVFLRTGTAWAEEATLLAPDGEVDDHFGYAVALTSDGSRALVGAPFDDATGGPDAGSARVFLRTGTAWTLEATLLPPDGASDDAFGASVALSSDGSRALVGAYLDDTAGDADAGSARVFLRTGTAWTQQATLLAPDGAANDYFGASVALTSDGSRALVGAYLDDTAGGSGTGSARVFLRTGSVWVQEATLLAPDGAVNDYFGVSVALTSDGSSALVGAYRDDTTGGADAGSARVFTMMLAANGSACGGDAACASGSCTDGVCCATRCAGGTSDCQACSGALTGGSSGICAPVSAGTTCRGSTSACDSAETCTGAATSCPTDVLAPSGVVCRAQSGACDVAEVCTGSSAACPVARIATAGAVCRPASTAGCDVAEVCDGATVNCPGDTFAGAGTVCRSNAGACDIEETCAGTSPVCPPDVVRDASVVCRPMTSACDMAESCTGASPDCAPDLFAPATTSCGPAATDVCDAPDHCAGTTALCIEVYRSGVECRASGGACDPAESCFGDSPSCPPSAVLPAGVSCRASTEPSCDPEETCDGLAASCPADVTSCVPRLDAGPIDAGARPDAGPDDAGARSDTGAATDAGTAPVALAGCGCRLAPTRVPARPLVVALIVLGLIGARRRR